MRHRLATFLACWMIAVGCTGCIEDDATPSAAARVDPSGPPLRRVKLAKNKTPKRSLKPQAPVGTTIVE